MALPGWLVNLSVCKALLPTPSAFSEGILALKYALQSTLDCKIHWTAICLSKFCCLNSESQKVWSCTFMINFSFYPIMGTSCWVELGELVFTTFVFAEIPSLLLLLLL